jgi:hypothetical protein
MNTLLNPRRWIALLGLVVWAMMVLAGAPRADAQVRMEVEAFSGAPFGVGRITLHSGGEFRLNRVPRPGGGRIAGLARKIAQQAGIGQTAESDTTEMLLFEKADRAFYPVFEKRDRPLLREFMNTPTEATMYFLFQGDAPLELTMYAPGPTTAGVAPRLDRAGYDRLLHAWWRDYAAITERNEARPYPPLVEEYLVDTLSRRLQLPIPQQPEAKGLGLFQFANMFKLDDAMQSELSLLMGTDKARSEAAKAILLGNAADQAATERLPEELPAAQPEGAQGAADLPIEPIAMRVPAECLYVRFGNFPNFLWLRRRMTEWGGELRDIVSERGLDYGLNERMQKQLGLRESQMAGLLGEKVIADVAMIGTDTFLSEGASIGMLFQAKNKGALSLDLQNQRLTALKESKNAKKETLKIQGRDVSFFSTPDNSLRSFYVADGDYQLVTTSRTLVEWFLATGKGKHPSLGASDDFRRARTNMPLSRNDTVFVYLAPAFFQNLLSPRYHIELSRRLRSAVEIELYQIAQLAAHGEQKPADTLDDLVAGGYLPQNFGRRADGSQMELLDGKLADSLRGGLGTFVPISDVEIEQVTRAEAAEYRKFADYYTAEWGPMDPVVAAVRQEPLPEGKLERVVVDLQAAPLSQKLINKLAQWLGPPTDQRLAQVPGNVVSFEAVLRGGTFFAAGDHHLFGALRDADTAFALDPNAGMIARMLTSQWDGLQGYVGAYPNPGFLQLFKLAPGTPPSPEGYSRLITGLWQRQADPYTLISYHPEILEQTVPQLRFEKAPRPAQIWFQAEDLLHSKLAPMLNAYGYRQSRQITSGNTKYMNMLTEQLHVPQAEARGIAERLLAAKMISPLGGEYEVREMQGGGRMWVSSALADRTETTQPPDDYQFPALNWLRGINFELSAENGTLAIHGEAIMPVETRPAAAAPSPFAGLLGGAKKPKPSDVESPIADKKPMRAKSPSKVAPLPAPSDVKPTGKRSF